jgi:hypothetical protein
MRKAPAVDLEILLRKISDNVTAMNAALYYIPHSIAKKLMIFSGGR